MSAVGEVGDAAINTNHIVSVRSGDEETRTYAVNVRYMIDALSQIGGAPAEVRFKPDKLQPILVRSEQERITVVVMPMQLQ